MAKNNMENIAPQEAKVKNWIIGISIAVPLAVAVLLFMPTKLWKNCRGNRKYFGGLGPFSTAS